MFESTNSPAEEDYLKAILALETAGEAITTSTLAGRLGLKPASVTGMLQRLAGRRLVAYRPYQAVRLTARGRATALATLRRHRLIELFLVRVLDLPWDRVHEEAERWEHVVSDDVIERMDQVLGRPQRDPHGAPIPQAGGDVATAAGRSLAEFDPGSVVRIEQIPDHDAALLRYLAGVGIVPDARLEILQVDPFDGPVTLKVGRRRQVVGREALRRVLAVEEAGRE